MKKKYIAPSIEMETLKTEAFLVGSDIHSDLGLGYGGVDGNGEYEADSRKASFDDEWFEE